MNGLFATSELTQFYAAQELLNRGHEEVCRMALAFYFAPKTPMSARQYDECIKRLKKAGAGHPPGRVYHACFEAGTGHQS
jgi:hypothetical protein